MTTRTLPDGKPLLPQELTDDEIIGERVHMLMFRGRRTQGWLAEVLQMTQAGVSRKLRGQRPWLASEVLSVAYALGVPASDLMPTPGEQRPVPPPETDPDAPGYGAVSQRYSACKPVSANAKVLVMPGASRPREIAKAAS